MTDIFSKYATTGSRTFTGLNSLANGSGLTEDSQFDNSTTRHINGYIDCTLNGASATTGSVDVYLLVGSETGVLSTTAKTSNMRRVGSVELNGTTAVQKQLFIGDLPKFWKIRVINNSGAALSASGNAIKFTGLNYTDT